jgi:hypothetical protein
MTALTGSDLKIRTMAAFRFGDRDHRQDRSLVKGLSAPYPSRIAKVRIHGEHHADPRLPSIMRAYARADGRLRSDLQAVSQNQLLANPLRVGERIGFALRVPPITLVLSEFALRPSARSRAFSII